MKMEGMTDRWSPLVSGFEYTDQWRRRVCRNAESPSMTSRMPTVSDAHAANSTKMSSELNGLAMEKPR